MKIIFQIILVVVIGFVSFGYYINYSNKGEGEKFIGIGVLIFAFILMPIFIYHRYKNKDLSRYSFQDQHKKEDKN